MKLLCGAAVAALSVLAAQASAQSLMEQAKGTWQGRTPACGDQVIVITDVDAKSGLIKGSFYCGQRNSTVSFAETAVPNRSIVGKIEGNKLTITGATSYQNLTFDGTRLSGPTGAPTLGLGEILVVYQKKQ